MNIHLFINFVLTVPFVHFNSPLLLLAEIKFCLYLDYYFSNIWKFQVSFGMDFFFLEKIILNYLK